MTDSGKTPAQDKTLVVLGSPGAGKATTMGHLIYMCGGIDMRTLERLEKGGNTTYAKAFNEIRASSDPFYFNTPMHRVTLTEETSTANGVLLIISPGQIAEQLQETGNQLQGVATLFAQGNGLVLVNKLDELGWSEGVFTESVRAAKAALQSLGVSIERTRFVPVSGLCSDNLMEPSLNLAWYPKPEKGGKHGAENGDTVVAALDQILS